MAGHFRLGFFEEYGRLAPSDKSPIVLFFYLITRLGHECVLIFFVMSGFLVGGKAIERMRDGKFNLVDYTINRTVRIGLPLISALLLYIPISYYTGTSINWWQWIGNLFSLQGILCGTVIAPLWSLSYEVWFYIFIGTVALVLRGGGEGFRWMTWLCMLIIIWVFMHLKVLYLFIWLLGAACYLLMPKSSNKFRLILSGIFVIGCLIGLQMTDDSRVIEFNQFQAMRPMMEVLFSFAFCIFLQQIILHEPKKTWSLRLNYLGTRLAAFSYTIYLVHPLVERMLTYIGAPKSGYINLISVSLYLVWLTLGMCVSYMVYLLFEKNTDFLKHKIKTVLSISRNSQK